MYVLKLSTTDSFNYVLYPKLFSSSSNNNSLFFIGPIQYIQKRHQQYVTCNNISKLLRNYCTNILKIVEICLKLQKSIVNFIELGTYRGSVHKIIMRCKNAQVV